MHAAAPLLGYLFVMFVSPGPNNVMLTTSGVNFGFGRTIPHMVGICLGTGLQLLACALLLAGAARWAEAARQPLAVVGCIYLLWLAYRIARADEPGAGVAARPMGIVEAALFQNVNPKAWIMVANTALLFMPRQGGVTSAFGLTLACVGVGLPCCAVWAYGGERLRVWLRRPAALHAFNYAMASLLAATALWMLVDEVAH